MKFTDEDRERAIEILAVQASTPNVLGSTCDATRLLGYRGLNKPTPPCEVLAFETWSHVYAFNRRADRFDTLEVDYAEAEALLREGFTPEIPSYLEVDRED